MMKTAFWLSFVLLISLPYFGYAQTLTLAQTKQMETEAREKIFKLEALLKIIGKRQGNYQGDFNLLFLGAQQASFDLDWDAAKRMDPTAYIAAFEKTMVNLPKKRGFDYAISTINFHGIYRKDGSEATFLAASYQATMRYFKPLTNHTERLDTTRWVLFKFENGQCAFDAASLKPLHEQLSKVEMRNNEVLFPNNREVLELGRKHEVRWYMPETPSVIIEVWIEGKPHPKFLKQEVLNTGSYLLDLAALPVSDGYKLRVFDAKDRNIYAESLIPFMVVPVLNEEGCQKTDPEIWGISKELYVKHLLDPDYQKGLTQMEAFPNDAYQSFLRSSKNTNNPLSQCKIVDLAFEYQYGGGPTIPMAEAWVELSKACDQGVSKAFILRGDYLIINQTDYAGGIASFKKGYELGAQRDAIDRMIFISKDRKQMKVVQAQGIDVMEWLKSHPNVNCP